MNAIIAADVGLAMGSGCSAAKDKADLILINDDFQATIDSVMWGRNIYHNVGRFLQFQLTVNFSALLLCCVASFFLADSPLTASQLLWVNMIMDTFAAFALATEPPLDSVLSETTFSAHDEILSPVIWRQVIGIALWNLLVLLFLIIFGPMLLGDKLKFSLTDNPNNSDAGGKAKKLMLTYIFHTFVFL